MEPELRLEELDAAAAVVAVALEEEEVVVVADVGVDVELVDEEDTLVEVGADPWAEEETGRPFAVRFTYAAQSGLGSAKGQLLAWHRESSSGPWAGFKVMGGAHRTL